jgi:hypothetical protein
MMVRKAPSSRAHSHGIPRGEAWLHRARDWWGEKLTVQIVPGWAHAEPFRRKRPGFVLRPRPAGGRDVNPILVVRQRPPATSWALSRRRQARRDRPPVGWRKPAEPPGTGRQVHVARPSFLTSRTSGSGELQTGLCVPQATTCRDSLPACGDQGCRIQDEQGRTGEGEIHWAAQTSSPSIAGSGRPAVILFVGSVSRSAYFASWIATHFRVG